MEGLHSGSLLPSNGRSRLDLGFPALKLAFPINSDDSIIPVWKSGLEQVIMTLVRTIKTWKAVDVLRRGYFTSSLDNPIEIVVTFEDMKLEDLPRLEQDLKRACIEVGRGDVQVDLREGKLQRFNEASTSESIQERGLSLRAPYDPRPAISTSISIRQGPSGTMGGFLELCEEGQPPRLVGLSCHHVVFPTETPEGEP